MIEIFKTNVCNEHQAKQVIDTLSARFPHYCANFDLDDCDHILRIDSTAEIMHPEKVIKLMAQLGFKATVLPDTILADEVLDFVRM